MGEEVEIRVRIKNPGEAAKKLGEKAVFKEEIKQEDIYFTPEQKDFFEEKPTDKYLRIRKTVYQDKKTNEIGFHQCYFEEDGSLLYTEEHETEIEDSKKMTELLEKLGYRVKVRVTKKRRIYRYKGFELVLDKIEELGSFLEVEAREEVIGKPEKKKKKCFQILEDFDLNWEKAMDDGYPDMLLEKRG